MPPRLRVLVSGSSSYPPAATCSVNSPTPTNVKSSNFEGSVSVWVKDYHGEQVGGDGHEYFDIRKDMTYAIVVNGEFPCHTIYQEVRSDGY
jgi:hypothetical protein